MMFKLLYSARASFREVSQSDNFARFKIRDFNLKSVNISKVPNFDCRRSFVSTTLSTSVPASLLEVRSITCRNQNQYAFLVKCSLLLTPACSCSSKRTLPCFIFNGVSFGSKLFAYAPYIYDEDGLISRFERFANKGNKLFYMYRTLVNVLISKQSRTRL